MSGFVRDQRGFVGVYRGKKKGLARRASFFEEHRFAGGVEPATVSFAPPPVNHWAAENDRQGQLKRVLIHAFCSVWKLVVPLRSRAVDCHDVPAVRSWRRLVNARRWPPTGTMAVQPTATRGQLPPPFSTNGPGQTVSRGHSWVPRTDDGGWGCRLAGAARDPGRWFQVPGALWVVKVFALSLMPPLSDSRDPC